VRWLTTDQAVKLLGVKPATLYAYVSRGLLRRSTGPDRRSRFASEEVEHLRQRGRRSDFRLREVTVHSGLTSVEDGQIRFRDADGFALAAERTFEEAAHWLWLGAFNGSDAWTSAPEAIAVGRRAQAALPPAALPLDRLRVTVAAMATTDPLRYELGAAAVPVTGRRLISALVDTLPDLREGIPAEGSIARRLWTKLSGEKPTTASAHLLDAALVILMDHELSFSTLSARLAASMRADPYAVVSIGLSALGGPLQSVASLAAEELLSEIDSPGRAAWVIGERLRRGDRQPGFGHLLYSGGDPRGAFLLRGLRTVATDRDKLAIVDAVLEATRERQLPAANVDFALAALANVTGMVRGASEAIFAIARTAGWIAHAMEEYQMDVRVRPKMIYMGPSNTPER